MLYVLDLMYWASYFYLCNFFLEGGWENKDTWRPDKDISLKQSKEPALVLGFNYCLFILCTIKGGGGSSILFAHQILSSLQILVTFTQCDNHTYTSMYWRYSIIYNTMKRNTISVNFLKSDSHYNINRLKFFTTRCKEQHGKE